MATAMSTLKWLRSLVPEVGVEPTLDLSQTGFEFETGREQIESSLAIRLNLGRLGQ